MASEKDSHPHASWLALGVVMMAQIQLSFNAFSVSIGGITQDLGIPATAVGTALTTGTFAMAAFILVGAKIGSKIGTRLAFRIGVLIPALAALAIATAQNGTVLFIAQATSGASVALSAPALTVLIASNYHGKQQAKAVGFLASAIPLAQVISLLIAGWFASTIGWRWSFALVALIGVTNFALSFLLKPIPPQKELPIDWVSAAIASVAIILISFGFSGLTTWGALMATPNAPFSVFGLSPVPFLLIGGFILGQLFLSRTRRRTAAGEPTLLSLSVVSSSQEKATLVAMSTMLFVGTATSFLLPLYMQVVQGMDGMATSLAVVPYTVSIFIANTLVVRLYERFSPAQIARTAFIVVSAALFWLSFTIRNDWGQAAVVVGLVTLGLAQGAIVALVFNTLLSSSPKHLAGDVGALRGLTHNISGSAGIAVATALAVAILGGITHSSAYESADISPELMAQINFDNVDFITNEQAKAVLERTSATPAEAEEAIALYEEARLRALRTTLAGLGLLALIAVVPVGRMPRFSDEELPVGYPEATEPDPEGLDNAASNCQGESGDGGA